MNNKKLRIGIESPKIIDNLAFYITLGKNHFILYGFDNPHDISRPSVKIFRFVLESTWCFVIIEHNRINDGLVKTVR